MKQIETKQTMTDSEKLFEQKIESNFSDMTKEEIITSLVSHVTSRTRLIQKWEKLAMESKGKDKRELLEMAGRERSDRLLITRLHINLDHW